MTSLFWHALAALGEIVGCFAFWAWLRLGKSPLWTLPDVVSLVCFALSLTRIDAAAADRAYAAYGGIYILSSLLWLERIEKNTSGSLGHARRVDLFGGSRRSLFGLAMAKTYLCATVINLSRAYE